MKELLNVKILGMQASGSVLDSQQLQKCQVASVQENMEAESLRIKMPR